jgi:hypothetical protein
MKQKSRNVGPLVDFRVLYRLTRRAGCGIPFSVFRLAATVLPEDLNYGQTL